MAQIEISCVEASNLPFVKNRIVSERSSDPGTTDCYRS